MAPEQKYRLLDSSEAVSFEELDDNVFTFRISKRTGIILFAILSLFLAGIIASIATITILLEEKPEIIYSLPQLPEPLYTDCGGSPEEARRRNCSFDWMMHTWFTPECHHADLLQEYYEKKQWFWSLTEDGTYVVPTDIIALGEHETAWTTEWFHREHCTYMWKKQLRYVQDWEWMDDTAHEYEHTDHCSKFVLEPTLLKNLNDTVLVPGYPKCFSLRREWDGPNN